ncbi:MAG: 6-phosphogluconolactonase [Aliihoeflea sp.]|uniref:6-phosphogluconolactonase n=1 Tax=Aliihoeflea sp. TaxID=2608088 RepID=UPI004034DBE7
MREFADSDAVAKALAGDVAGRLAEAIAARGRAVLAVSGGTTPVRFFGELAKAAIDWSNVIVTLVDERFVPPSHERSNERLVRENLLIGRAAEARFVPMYFDAGSVEEAARLASEAVSRLMPVDVLVLGMGTDGHTASLFPDAVGIAEMLRPPAPSRAAPEPPLPPLEGEETPSTDVVLPVYAPSAGEARLTLSLAAICKARAVFLHIEGAQKRGVLERAAAEKLPVAAVLAAAETPVVTYWAP